MRTEFHADRTECSCGTCIENCRTMPGCLIPSDLERMIPKGVDPFAWAEKNLLASPGAIAMKNGETFRIPTLVPAKKAGGSCIHLDENNRCEIHAIAPFGCAFFDCTTESLSWLANAGMQEVFKAHQEQQLYHYLWIHLMYKGLEQEKPEVLRERMSEKLNEKLQSEAVREVERLRAEGWTPDDFAQALKHLLTGRS